MNRKKRRKKNQKNKTYFVVKCDVEKSSPLDVGALFVTRGQFTLEERILNLNRQCLLCFVYTNIIIYLKEII